MWRSVPTEWAYVIGHKIIQSALWHTKTMMQNKHRTKNLSNHAKKLHSNGHTFPLPKHSSERNWKLLEAGDTLCVVGLSAQNRGTYSSQDCGPWTQGRYWGKKCPTLVWESFSLNRWDWHPSPIVMGPDVPAIIRICFYGDLRGRKALSLWSRWCSSCLCILR